MCIVSELWQVCRARMHGCQCFKGYGRAHGAYSLAFGLVVRCASSVHQPRPCLHSGRRELGHGAGLHSLAVGPVHIVSLFVPNREGVVFAQLPFAPVALPGYLYGNPIQSHSRGDIQDSQRRETPWWFPIPGYYLQILQGINSPPSHPVSMRHRRVGVVPQQR